MNGAAWEQLAIQAPIVLIFAGVVYFLIKENNKQSKEQYLQTKELTIQFMTFMENHDKVLVEEMKKIASCLENHDRKTDSHDVYVREKWKDLG